MIEFFVFYIALCIFLVVQYLDKDNVFSLENYLNFKKNINKINSNRSIIVIIFYNNFNIK